VQIQLKVVDNKDMERALQMMGNRNMADIAVGQVINQASRQAGTGEPYMA
jgi:hypothetical protein